MYNRTGYSEDGRPPFIPMKACMKPKWLGLKIPALCGLFFFFGV